jgi:hypothetical protein
MAKAAGSTTSVPPNRYPRQLRNILFNSRGFRAGWRFLMYLSLVVGLGFIVNRLHLFLENPLGGFAVSEGIIFGPAWVMSKLERRPMAVYGLPGRGAFGKLFLLGWFAGLVEVSALIGFLKILHIYSFGALVLHRADLIKWTLMFLGIFFEKALFYQFLIRGYSQFTLGEGIGFWSASELLCALSVWSYLPSGNTDLIGLPVLFVVGLFWSLTLRRTGSLWFAIGMNASFDVGGTFLYSMPNLGFGFPFDVHLSNPTVHGPAWLTGGTLGIEGSFLRLLSMAIFVSLLNRFYPAREDATSLRKYVVERRELAAPPRPLG